MLNLKTVYRSKDRIDLYLITDDQGNVIFASQNLGTAAAVLHYLSGNIITIDDAMTAREAILNWDIEKQERRAAEMMKVAANRDKAKARKATRADREEGAAE